MYTITYHSSIKKDFRKAGKDFGAYVLSTVAVSLREDPTIGNKMRGFTENMWRYRFHFRGVSYRICYIVKNKQLQILVVAIGKRADIYKTLSQRMK
jgi:mRNA-degrading endonuclease RelE of RelBE toxin-antitoxin system